MSKFSFHEVPGGILALHTLFPLEQELGFLFQDLSEQLWAEQKLLQIHVM